METKALVVDDNANNPLLEKDLLELANFEVFVADNAASGMAIAIKEKPDIIIMDVRLPDMRGSKARPRIYPIVFVTASVITERA